MRVRPRELCSDCANGAPMELMSGGYTCSALSRQVPVHEIPSHCLYYDGPRLPVDVVIITAVSVEWDAVVNELHPEGRGAWEPLSTVADGYWEICLYQSRNDSRVHVRLALAKTRTMGLSAAASLTALAIQLFRPSHVVMLGITAGRQDKTKIGDIVVPLELWDYGAGKWEEHEGELVFKPGEERRNLEEHVRQRCEILARKTEALQTIREDWMNRRTDREAHSTPVVHFEPMVSGAAVVSAEAIWRHVLRHNRKIIAIDMEAYGVAFATCNAAIPLYNPNFLIAKSVCDFGVKKVKDAQAYAAYTSVRFFGLYLDEFVIDEGSRRVPAKVNVPSTE